MCKMKVRMGWDYFGGAKILLKKECVPSIFEIVIKEKLGE